MVTTYVIIAIIIGVLTFFTVGVGMLLDDADIVSSFVLALTMGLIVGLFWLPCLALAILAALLYGVYKMVE